MALAAAVEAARHDRVGKREERGFVTAHFAQPFDVELELLVEHALEPPGGHVPVRLAVDGVADGHVVGGDRTRDGARGAAHAEEPARDLLAGADLGDRPVPARIEVNAQGLLMSVGLMSAGELGHPSPCPPGRCCRLPPRPQRRSGTSVGRRNRTDFAVSGASPGLHCSVSPDQAASSGLWVTIAMLASATFSLATSAMSRRLWPSPGYRLARRPDLGPTSLTPPSTQT